jgi:ElaB/YqjD/DUF883 family membrane-anchored ribosome-binding protein
MTERTGIETAKSQLLEDFDKIVADTEALLRSLASAGGEKAASMRGAVEANLESAKARLRDLKGTAAEKAEGAAREADAYVHENPWTAIGVAAIVGVVVGLLIGTRR